jgi:serine/threonine-protein kinase
MAPEQASGRREQVTIAADVWGLGAILYELLTGQPPFRAETPLATLQLLRECEPRPPRLLQPGLPRDLETICLKCLHKGPAQRYASTQALADDLRRLQRGEAILARPVGRLERAARWCRRNPAVALLSGALAASLLLGFVVLAVLWRRAEGHAEEAERAAARAQANLAEAERQRAREKESFTLAHQAVDEFCLRLADEQLKGIAGMQAPRRDLLRSGLRYYEKFVELHGDDPRVRRQLAFALGRLGSISGELGAKAEAAAHFQRALGIFEELRRGQAGDAALKEAHARAGLFLGMALREVGKSPDETLRRSRALYEELVKEQPANRNHVLELAAVHATLGKWLVDRGQIDQARVQFEGQVALLQPWLKAQPGDAVLQAQHAKGLRNLVAVCSQLGRGAEARALLPRICTALETAVKASPTSLLHRWDLARAYIDLARSLPKGPDRDATFEKGHGMLEKLVRDNPAVMGLRQELSASFRERGHRLVARKEWDQALRAYQQAHDEQERVVQASTGNPEAVNELAKCCFDMATVLQKFKQLKEARERLEKAAALRRPLVEANPGRVQFRCDLGVTLDRLGDVLWNQGLRAQGIRAVREGLELQRQAWKQAPQVARHRLYLSHQLGHAATLSRLEGNRDDALARLAERRRVAGSRAEELYHTAQEYARVAELPSGSNEARALAVDTLRQAVAAGLQNTNRLRGDPAWKSFREQPDFVEVLAGLTR